MWQYGVVLLVFQKLIKEVFAVSALVRNWNALGGWLQGSSEPS